MKANESIHTDLNPTDMHFIQRIKSRISGILRPTIKPTVQSDPVGRLRAYVEEQDRRGALMMKQPYWYDRDSGSNVGKHVLDASRRLRHFLETTEFSEDHITRLEEVTQLIIAARDSRREDAENFGLGTYNLVLRECLAEFDRLGLPRPVEDHYED